MAWHVAHVAYNHHVIYHQAPITLCYDAYLSSPFSLLYAIRPLNFTRSLYLSIEMFPLR